MQVVCRLVQDNNSILPLVTESHIDTLISLLSNNRLDTKVCATYMHLSIRMKVLNMC